MKKMKENKIVKSILVLFLCSIMIFFLTGCSKQDEGEKIKVKVNEEIHYIESKILQMLNDLNNIKLSDYKISTETMQGDAEDASKKQKNETGDGSSGSQSENTVQYKAVPNVVVGSDYTPQWNNLKSDIESTQNTWASIVLDLYQVGIPDEEIVGFSNDLNVIITNISAENKTDSLNNLAKLYGYLPNYLNHFLNDQKEVQLAYTKSHVINAYVLIEQEDWTGIDDNLNKAEEAYVNVLNQEGNQSSAYNQDRAYILLKEMRNAIGMQNKEVLYVKYKALIEELNLL